ncbi:MAG: MFS transporter [Gammaproteobacteria bacterium]
MVFLLVAAAFTNLYVTQPILPVLEADFGSSTVQVAMTVSAVLLGLALANLPFGLLSDRVPVGPLIVVGGALVAAAGLVCAATARLDVLVAARFCQGLATPALTTCLAAHLARTLPFDRLNVAMGAYVAATVLGGMFGRLLGGFVFEPAAWRSAFVAAAGLVLTASLVAVRLLPGAAARPDPAHRDVSYPSLLGQPALLLLFLCGAAGQAIFSPVFNTVPYRLAEAGFDLTPRAASLVYLVYLVGIGMGPMAGRLSNRWGNGLTLAGGAGVLAVSLGVLALPSVTAVVAGLVGVCAGFFAVHAAAVGALNRHLEAGQGRANALYVLCYYLGAWFGITWSAWVYQHAGWATVMALATALTLVPCTVGVLEARRSARLG